MNDVALKILEAASEEFMKYGIRSVSMDDISRKLGMSKKTLYAHFSKKAELVKSVSLAFIEKDKEALRVIHENSRDAIDELVLMARYVLSILREVPQTVLYDMKKYHRSCWNLFDNFHQKFIYQTIYDNIERGIAEGYYREEVNPDILARLYVGKSLWISDETLFPANSYNMGELYFEFIIYHIHGLASSKGVKKLNNYLEQEKL